VYLGAPYAFFNKVFFFLISKRISLKKRKAPPSTQDVYTEATQLAHIKNPIKPQGTHKKTPNKHNRNLHKTKEPPIVTPEYKKKKP
jgi:hypothetical protein